MKNARLLSAFLFLLLLSPCSKQKPLDSSQIIDELKQKAQTVDSYRVDTKISMAHIGNEMMTTTGKMAFKRPNMMHMTTTTDMMGGMTQETYRSQNVMWTYMPLMKMATKVELPEMGDAMPGQQNMGAPDPAGMLQNFPKEAITVGEKQIVDGSEVYSLQVSPEHLREGMTSPQQNAPMAPTKIEFLIYADNGLPCKMLTYGKDGALIMEQSYTNYEVNVPIPDSEFEFTPPEGVQVMDMSEAAKNMMNQMKEKMGKAHPAPHE